MLDGKKTYIGIGIIIAAELLRVFGIETGVDSATAITVLRIAGIELDAGAQAFALSVVTFIGAGVAAYGRWKAAQLKGDPK